MVLAFPSYEFLKSIKEEKNITIFTIYGNIYGRLKLNEDRKPGVWFDLVLNGYSGETVWSRYFEMTKKEYDRLYVHVQKCYNEILNNLMNQNHDWQNEQKEFELKKVIEDNNYDWTWDKPRNKTE